MSSIYAPISLQHHQPQQIQSNQLQKKQKKRKQQHQQQQQKQQQQKQKQEESPPPLPQQQQNESKEPKEILSKLTNDNLNRRRSEILLVIRRIRSYRGIANDANNNNNPNNNNNNRSTDSTSALSLSSPAKLALERLSKELRLVEIETMRRHVLSCPGLKGGDASEDDGGSGNRRRNGVGSGNNAIDVALGALDEAEGWISSCGERADTVVAPVDMNKDQIVQVDDVLSRQKNYVKDENSDDNLSYDEDQRPSPSFDEDQLLSSAFDEESSSFDQEDDDRFIDDDDNDNDDDDDDNDDDDDDDDISTGEVGLSLGKKMIAVTNDDDEDISNDGTPNAVLPSLDSADASSPPSSSTKSLPKSLSSRSLFSSSLSFPLRFLFVIVRGTLLHAPPLLLLLLLSTGSILRETYLHYYEPLMDALTWTEEHMASRRTYYLRTCTLNDVSTLDPDDLILDPTIHDAKYAADLTLKNGLSLFPNLLQPETIQTMRDYVLRRNDVLTDDDPDKIWLISEGNRWSFVISAESDPSVPPVLQQIASDELLRDTINLVMGTDPAIVEFTAITSSYGAGHQHWHADTDYDGGGMHFARDFVPMYSLFIPLQDTTAEMGSTSICPGTHLCGEGGTIREDCDELGMSLGSKKNEVWKAGHGMLMHLNTMHRGPGHVDPNGEHRVMLVLSIAPRPIGPGLDPRQIALGTSYSNRWDMWGLTMSDLAHTGGKENQPWRTLRALGIHKREKYWHLSKHDRWGWDHFTVVCSRIVNDGMGYRFEDLEDWTVHTVEWVKKMKSSKLFSGRWMLGILFGDIVTEVFGTLPEIDLPVEDWGSVQEGRRRWWNKLGEMIMTVMHRIVQDGSTRTRTVTQSKVVQQILQQSYGVIKGCIIQPVQMVTLVVMDVMAPNKTHRREILDDWIGLFIGERTASTGILTEWFNKYNDGDSKERVTTTPIIPDGTGLDWRPYMRQSFDSWIRLAGDAYAVSIFFCYFVRPLVVALRPRGIVGLCAVPFEVGRSIRHALLMHVPIVVLFQLLSLRIGQTPWGKNVQDQSYLGSDTVPAVGRFNTFRSTDIEDGNVGTIDQAIARIRQRELAEGVILPRFIWNEGGLTTLPDPKRDVMVGSRLESHYLAGHNDVFRYQPGTEVWYSMVEGLPTTIVREGKERIALDPSMAVVAAEFKGVSRLPPFLLERIASDIISTVHLNGGRFLLQGSADGSNFVIMDRDDTLLLTIKAIVSRDVPLLGEIISGNGKGSIASLVSECRHGQYRHKVMSGWHAVVALKGLEEKILAKYLGGARNVKDDVKKGKIRMPLKQQDLTLNGNGSKSIPESISLKLPSVLLHPKSGIRDLDPPITRQQTYYAPGEYIESMFEDDGWYRATVLSSRIVKKRSDKSSIGHQMLHVLYEDGEYADLLTEDASIIRHHVPYVEGDFILSQINGVGKMEGVVLKALSDNTLTVLFEDGFLDGEVELRNIHRSID